VSAAPRGAAAGSLLPATRESLVAALGTSGEEARQRALELIGRAYLVPVTALLALRWQLARPDAEDLAQGFFAKAIEKDWFRRFDPARGRFRTFLRSCLDDFARTEHRDAHREKRGGSGVCNFYRVLINVGGHSRRGGRQKGGRRR
jgi:RNA polymerase sigma-70 factor (ECF subfamily)